MTTMSPDQCRAARGLLRWTQPRLADASGIGLSTLNRFEKETRPPKEKVVRRLQATLEEVGVEFLFESEQGGIGVRLKRKSTTADRSSSDRHQEASAA